MRHAWVIALMLVGAGCDGKGGVKPPVQTPPEIEQGTPDPLPDETPAPVVVAPAPVSPEVRPLPGTVPATLTLLPSVSLEPNGAKTVSEVSQVGVHVDVIGASGEHRLTVAFLTPSGATYQVMEQAFVGSAYDSVGVDFALPVAGTAIDSHDLEGTWTAQVLIDGDEHSRPTFELAP